MDRVSEDFICLFKDKTEDKIYKNLFLSDFSERYANFSILSFSWIDL
jgi:hypothetical protein